MRLIITEENESKEYQLDRFKKDTIGFGRQTDSDIVLKSPYVSRLHGCLYKENGHWYIKDLESTYGIYCKDKKISDLRLSGGEHIRIKSSNGECVEFIFVNDNNADNNSVNDKNINANKNNENYDITEKIKNSYEPVISGKTEKKKKKGIILLVSIISVLIIAAGVITVLLLTNKKDYKKLSREATIEAMESLYLGTSVNIIKKYTDYDYQEIYDYISQIDYYDDIEDSDDLKDYLSVPDDEYDEYEELYNEHIEETSDGFIYREPGEDYYDEIKVGEAEEISKIDEKDIRRNMEEIDDVDDDIFDYLMGRLKKADRIYKVRVDIEGFGDYDEFDEDLRYMSFYDFVYVKDKKCISLISRINRLETMKYYAKRASKGDDVSSAKTIKTAVETVLSDEDIYTYLTDTNGFGYIYFIPGGTNKDDIILDVDYQHNHDDYIGSRDVQTDLKDYLFENLGDKIPDMKCKDVLDESVGSPVCYVAAVNKVGKVYVFSSVVESGFWCDEDGYTNYGYQMCPDMDRRYQ